MSWEGGVSVVWVEKGIVVEVMMYEVEEQLQQEARQGRERTNGPALTFIGPVARGG